MYPRRERDKITQNLMHHFPNTRRHDVRGRTTSLSFALTLPLSEGASWSLDNGSLFEGHEEEWQVIIHDPVRGYLTAKYNKDIIFAVCECWLAWKKSQEVETK